MKLVTPDIGLLFWMLVSFSIVLFLLKKYAWKPILNSLKEREETIAGALNSAKKAKEEMLQLKSDNEKILAQARMERDLLLKEARETKDGIINEAKAKAQVETDRLLKQAREGIIAEKTAAINEIKNQVSSLSIQIAEKVLQRELASADQQKAYVQDMIKDIKLN
ncbi:MAG: F0F1 ATP synthase subunit B [Bacteroidia bacterium]